MIETYQGKPCLRGHPGLRRKDNSECMDCRKERSIDRRKWGKDNPMQGIRNGKYSEHWSSVKGRGGVLSEEQWKAKREYERHHHSRVQQFGMTHDRYNEMFAEQGGKCKICGGPPTSKYKAFAIDHDHATNKIRGLLCGQCNSGLGFFRDQASLLRKAADYVEQLYV